MDYNLGFNDKIKFFTAGILLKVVPLPVHKPSGKPINMQTGNVLLAFNCSTVDELRSIRSFVANIRQKNASYTAMVYISKGDIPMESSDDGVYYVSHSDFNFFGRIKKRLSLWLKDNEFNLLICFSSEIDLFYNRMITSVVADFKTGSYNPENVNLFDLTIKQKPESYIKQLEHFNNYLNKLNINI